MTQHFGSPQPNTPIAPEAPSPFLGTFITVADIPLDGAVTGNYADVDGGAGLDVERYIYDVTDNKFVKSTKAIAGETAASVKQKYESNADTNAFTNVEKSKLSSIGTAATRNTGVNDGQLPLAENTFRAAYSRIGATLQSGDCNEFSRGTIYNVYASVVLNAPSTTFGDIYYIVHTYAAHNTFENSLIQVAYGFSKPVMVMRSANQGNWSPWQLTSTNPITYNTTTAAGANVVVATNGVLQRSTSSLAYKQVIADLLIDNTIYEKIIALNPIVYRSTAEVDNPEHHFYSFAAEELGELDPALVLWRDTETVIGDDGLYHDIPLSKPQADGLNINAIVAFLHATSVYQHNLIAEQATQIRQIEEAIVVIQQQLSTSSIQATSE